MIDLHTHSTASDGTSTPSELIEEAVKTKLYAIALTDHDTVSGLKECEEKAKDIGFSGAVSGVELSVRLRENSVHLCGLFINRKCEELISLLRWIRNKRDERNKKIIHNFNKLGYKITCEELNDTAVGESQGRPHMARILVSKGYFSDIQEVFDKLLKKGKDVYVERELPSPEMAVNIIKIAGGLPIWAHPFANKNIDRRSFRQDLKYLKSLGLVGIEAYYSTYTREIQDYLVSVANEENMLISGGSDYHGQLMDSVKLGKGMGGLSIPDEIFENLRNKYLSSISGK